MSMSISWIMLESLGSSMSSSKFDGSVIHYKLNAGGSTRTPIITMFYFYSAAAAGL